MVETTDTVREIAAGLSHKPGALLPVLHAVQDRFGYLPEGSIPAIADVLNLSRADVHGVVTFYEFFRETPPAKQVLFICRAEACQSMGANRLVEHARQKLQVEFHESTRDGRFSMEPVFCLGNCACAPAIMIDETVHGRVTSERFDELVS